MDNFDHNHTRPYSDLVVRPLTGDDSEAYKSLRQTVLAIGEGRFFESTYAREHHFKDANLWYEWCKETHEHCTMGIFMRRRLIGVMGIARYGAATDLMVEWEETWLHPDYRGLGIARLAYIMVQKWTISHGYKYAIVIIRDDNLRSREIRKKQGAVYMGTKHGEIWADGSVCDAHYYMFDLEDHGHAENRVSCAAHIETVFWSMQRHAPVSAPQAYAA